MLSLQIRVLANRTLIHVDEFLDEDLIGLMRIILKTFVEEKLFFIEFEAEVI